MAEDTTGVSRAQRVSRAAYLVGCLAAIGLAAALLHPECYVLPEAPLRGRTLLGAAALALWVIVALRRQAILSTLPGRLVMAGALAVIFDWTRGVSFAGFQLGSLKVEPSWSIIPLVVLTAAWLVQVAHEQSSPRSAGAFPLAVLLSSGLLIAVALLCFPLFGFRYDVGTDTFASVLVTAVQFGVLALSGLDLFGRGMPRWGLVALGAMLAAKVVLQSVMPQ